MVDVRQKPPLFATPGEVLDEGIGRAGHAIDAVVGRAREAVDGVNIDAGDVEETVRHAIATLRENAPLRVEAAQAAQDRERLKVAVIAGLVLMAISAAVFLAVRSRRASQERRSRRRRTSDR
jgi:hypothetical protein